MEDNKRVVGSVQIRASISEDSEKIMKKYCKENGYKISQFVDIAIKHELESRLYGLRRNVWK